VVDDLLTASAALVALLHTATSVPAFLLSLPGVRSPTLSTVGG
jgi:hypothetical protein